MKMLYAEQQPTSGEVRVSGASVSDLRPSDIPMLRRRLGIVFQDFRLLEDRTAAENIAFALEVTSARRDTIAARVMRVLTQVGLAAKGAPTPASSRRRAAAAWPSPGPGERPGDHHRRRAHRQPRRARHPKASSSFSATSTRPAPSSSWRRTTWISSARRPTGPSSCARAPWSSTARWTRRRRRRSRETADPRGAPLVPPGAAPLALSITTIAFSLFTVGLFGLVAINLRQALRGIEERVEIVAFVLRGTPAETITLATQDIAAFPEVQDVSYVTEEQALARARVELVEFRDAYRDLATNPLPASIGAARGGLPGLEDGRARRRADPGFGFVDDVRYGRDWVQRLDQLRNVTGIVGLVIGLAFAMVAVVIIGVTIRLTILQRARRSSSCAWWARPTGSSAARSCWKARSRACWAGSSRWCSATPGTCSSAIPPGGPFAGLLFFRPEHMVVILVFGVLLGLAGSLVSVGRHLRNV